MLVLIFGSLSVNAQPRWLSWEYTPTLNLNELETLIPEMKARDMHPYRIDSAAVNSKFGYTAYWLHNSNSQDNIIKTGMSGKEFLAESIEYRKQGYYPLDIAVTSTNSTPSFAMLLYKGDGDGGPKWQTDFGLSKQEFIEKSISLGKEGYIPTIAKAYYLNREIKYFGKWEYWSKNRPDRDSVQFGLGLSKEDLLQSLKRLPKGYMPEEIHALQTGSAVVYSFIAFANSIYKDVLVTTSMTKEEFSAKLESGYRLVSVSSFNENSRQDRYLFAGIIDNSNYGSATTLPVYRVPETIGVAPPSSSRILPIVPVMQKTRVWCWLAVGEMIFKSRGIPSINSEQNTQCGIIGTIEGNSPCALDCFNQYCIRPSGSNASTIRMLKNFAWMSAKKRFSASEGYELPLSMIKADIDSGRPIGAGISTGSRKYYLGADHIALIVGYEVRNNFESIYVNDPYPYNSGENPYIRYGGSETRPFQYKISLKAFTEGVFWHWSIYNINFN